MDSSTLVNNLVETYRNLNTVYRAAPPNDTLIAIVSRMRNDEIQFSQALKDRITGIGTAGGPAREFVDGSDTTLAQVISQFGTARATTLNLLKGIQDDGVWDTELDDGSTIRAHVQDLTESDSRQLARLSQAVSS